MKKSICFLCVLACFITCFTACSCEHTWRQATCLLPQTCTQCNETQGEALGHTWQEATCSAPKTCSTCNTTEGETLPHTWQEATCKAPKTCSVCKITEGKVGAHQWQAATCTTKKTCKVCKVTQGNTLEHKISGGVCQYCKKTIPAQTNFKLQSGEYISEYVGSYGYYFYIRVNFVANANGSYIKTSEMYAPTSGKGAATVDFFGESITKQGTFTFEGKKYWADMLNGADAGYPWVVVCKGNEVIVKDDYNGSILMKFKGNSNGTLSCTYSEVEDIEKGAVLYPEKDFVGKAKGNTTMYR